MVSEAAWAAPGGTGCGTFVDVSRPHCYLAALESGTANVVVVMEDLAPAEQGDQIIGCSVEQATLAVDEAVKLHGPRWGDPALQGPRVARPVDAPRAAWRR